MTTKFLGYAVEIDGQQVVIPASECYLEIESEEYPLDEDETIKVTLQLPFDVIAGGYPGPVVIQEPA